MENLELVLLKPRARKMPEQVYVVGVVKAGDEQTSNPPILLYATGSNVAFLGMLIKEHNDLVKSKAKVKSK